MAQHPEDDYGTPAYSALSGAGFGFTPEIYRAAWGAKGRGPKDYRRSDERIHEEICESLMLDGSIDSSDVSVKVEDGKVTLEGTVPVRLMRYQIEDLADHMGAQDIDNNIRVRG
jgi:osmotically-inducible protein OsmY